MANVQMEFPGTWEEYEKDCGFNDSEEVYTNNARLIPSFRVKQWLDHLPSIQPKKGHWISDKYGQHCDQCGNGINTPYKFCPFCGADMREYTKE